MQIVTSDVKTEFCNQFWISETDYRFLKRLSVNRLSLNITNSNWFACSVYSELYATEMFEEMSISADEDEHSIEMQLPYIAKVMERFGR